MSNYIGIPQRPSTLPPTPAMLLNNLPLQLQANNNQPTPGLMVSPPRNNNINSNGLLPMGPPSSIPGTSYNQQQQVQQVQPQKQIFNFEPHLRRQFGFGLNPDRPICEYWKQSGGKNCPNGTDCPLKHPSKIFQNKIVCKYWLRGLCKMGNDCDFLHEYNLSRMPECAYYAQNGVCTQGPECVYLHVDPQSKIPECFNYSDLGFCPDGPNCTRRHVRKTMCPLYLTGFCPKGKKCELAHARFKLGLIQGQLKFRIMTDEQIIELRKQKLAEEKVKDEQEPEPEEKKLYAAHNTEDEPSEENKEVELDVQPATLL